MGASCSTAKCNKQAGPAIEVRYKHLLDIKYLPGWQGAKCDSVGFFQHYGECWNDSLQMILLYTDGLKELTQPLLYNTEITQAWVDEHIEEKARGTKLSEYMFYYLRALQRRFKRHYATEVSVRRLSGTCNTGDEEMRKAKLGMELYYRRMGVNAVQGAIYGSLRPNANTLNIEKYTKNEGSKGQSMASVDILLVYLLNILGIESNVSYKVKQPQETILTQEFLSPAPFPESLKAVRLSAGNHATVFYICGGTYYYYDDNSGPIPFRWDIFLKADSYEGICDFILGRKNPPPITIPASKKSLKKNNALTAKAKEQREQTKQAILKIESSLLIMTGHFKLIHHELREGDFYHAYYPFIFIQNNENEQRFYTLSPITGEPRYYTGFEFDPSTYVTNDSFFPIYVTSDATVENMNYTFVPSALRNNLTRGLRNNTLNNTFKRHLQITKNFKPGNHFTRRNNKRNR